MRIFCANPYKIVMKKKKVILKVLIVLLCLGALGIATLFGINGIGYTGYQAMVAGDIPFSMFFLTFLAAMTLLGNLISDILYAAVDPRVRLGG